MNKKKNRANTLSAILSNMTDLEGAYNDALKAEGSALKENEAYLQSIQGHIDLFNNSLQTMWMNFVETDAIKWFVHLGQAAVEFADDLGLIQTALIGIVGYLTFFKKTQWHDMFTSMLPKDGFKNPVKEFKNTFENGFKNGITHIWNDIRSGSSFNLLTGSQLDAEIKNLNVALAQGPEALAQYKIQAQQAGNGMDIFVNKLEQGVIQTKNGKVAAQDYTLALQQQTTEAQKAARSEQLKSAAIGIGIMVVTTVISAISNYVQSLKTLEETYEELQSSISDLESKINSIDSELAKIDEQIDALSNRNLSLVEAEELRKLREQSAELQKQKELHESILKTREKQNSVQSLSMINKLLDTTAANQEKTASSAKMWGSIIGGVVLAAVGAVAAYFTAGSSLALTAAGIGMVAGSAAGGAIGENLGSQSKAISGDDAAERLINWYDSYEKAIDEAAREANEAEQKYFNDTTDANYETWQKKLEEVNTLQTDMYNGLQEMQEYVGNLEYNDQTSGIVDGYNKLMTSISVKSLDGDIDAQISSVKSLQDEFYELSRGVDENGKNIALTAEEYARYNSILDQLIAYNSGIYKSYDEQGNVILKALDSQVAYNQVLEETIRLLREQKIEAAKASISHEEISKVVDGAQKEYKNQLNNTFYVNTPKALNIDSSKNPHGWLGGANWGTDDVTEEISKVIGVDFNMTFGDQRKYLIENIDLIKAKREEITNQLTQTMIDSGAFDETTITNYVVQTNKWLDDIIAQMDQYGNEANAKIREKLYLAPQTSEHYYDMSGEQLNFVNSYIASIEDLKDKTAEDIEKITSDIVGLMSLIDSSKNLQGSINELMTLDPSSMPIEAYRKKFEELWAEAGAIIPVEQQEAFRNYLFPDESQIDTMIADVQEKLVVGSNGLVKNLNLEELRVAWKIIPELSDNISFDELRKEIQERLPKATGPIVETYSTLLEQVEKFNEVTVQTSEIVLNNTKVTQEYKDSLVELGVSEEELAECFDATNSLVVTNAKKLNNLLKSAKKNTAQNAQLAKSQARLQYYELYKKMDLLVGANGEIVDGNIDVVRSLYEEMNALEKTIAKYSMLEAQLLGNVNAFEKFQEAQEIDSETDYIGSAEEMVLALGQAFNTAELGSETAQAAIMGLVPESVYEDLDTLDEKMAAIYQYFRKGKIAQYFALEYDEDGNIESAEMKLGNLRKFIEDGLSGDNNKDGINPFVGEDWQHFELNQTWLDSLPEGTDVLQALADQMNVTKEVAFAFVKSFKDHDIEWLDGDYSTFFDQMLASTNEGKIQLYTERLADLTMQQAELAAEKAEVTKQYNAGSISQEEYNKKIEEINKKQEELNKSLGDYNTKLAEAKNASKQNIFGVGDKGTQYEGKADYQIKTSAEIEATDNLDDLDNWIERNEKVKQLQQEQADAQEEYQKALEEYEASQKTEEDLANLKKKEQAWRDTTAAVSNAIAKRDEFVEPTVLEIEVAIDDIEAKIESTRKTLDEKLTNQPFIITVDGDQQSITSTEQLLDSCFHIDEDGYWVINAGVNKSELEQKYPEILSYVSLLNSNTTLTSYLDAEDTKITLETVTEKIEQIIGLLEGIKISLDADSKASFEKDINNLLDKMGFLGAAIKLGKNWLTGAYSDDGASGAQNVNGTAHASGNWGLPSSEHNSLVGELGPEMVVDPHSGRYYTVGDNGAEMVDLPKGAIIFNHKQTEGLLKNGYVTSRGKAYAEGNAHVTIWPDASSKTEWKGTGYSGPDDPTYNLQDALDDAADSVNEFEETIDWIEIRMEEFDERIGKLNAELENQTTYAQKNSKINAIITENQKKYADSLAGAAYYENFANKYLDGMNSDLVTAAKNGAIAITEFTKEQDEATVKAIQNYRDYSQKAADLYQQAEEILTEIRDLAIQKIDNIQNYGSAKTGIEDAQTEKLQNRVDLDEERGLVTSSAYYTAMMENSGKKIEYWRPLLADMQKQFDDAVQNGRIERGTVEWYEQLAKLYEVQAEIDAATIELEEFQNAINDIYWDNFDQLINRLDYLKDETQSLIDLMDNEDMVITPETDDGWTSDQVEWTKEGMASLGLYAQQMEIAEYQSKQYANAIDDLTKEYDAGHYSENEYLEKLEELKSAQYDSIEAYYDAQDAIKDLQEARVDEIKNGIEKQVEAYEKLIDAKKKALETEKD